MNHNITIPYTDLIDSAMRGVIRQVLRQVEKTGLPGESHFYITFFTEYPGVQVSDTLKSRYPNEMTIVMQHQFWDFAVEDDLFRVTLSFGGTPEPLTVPFAALIAFADPSTKFGLQFQKLSHSDDTMPVPLDYDQLLGPDVESMLQDDDSDESAEIISLDAFRKK